MCVCVRVLGVFVRVGVSVVWGVYVCVCGLCGVLGVFFSNFIY